MDISKWPIDKIMQLPDHCFGRKFVVSCAIRVVPEATVWDISEIALPNVFVLWQLQIYPYGFTTADSRLRIALGDKLPTSETTMNGYIPLISDLGMGGTKPRRIYLFQRTGTFILFMRMPISAQGKRLVIEGHAEADANANVSVQIVVSAIPKEIPEWLLSGRV